LKKKIRIAEIDDELTDNQLSKTGKKRLNRERRNLNSDIVGNKKLTLNDLEKRLQIRLDIENSVIDKLDVKTKREKKELLREHRKLLKKKERSAKIQFGLKTIQSGTQIAGQILSGYTNYMNTSRNYQEKIDLVKKVIIKAEKNMKDLVALQNNMHRYSWKTGAVS